MLLKRKQENKSRNVQWRNLIRNASTTSAATIHDRQCPNDDISATTAIDAAGVSATTGATVPGRSEQSLYDVFGCSRTTAAA